MNECIDLLGESDVCKTPVAHRDYWQVELREEDCLKTELVCHFGHQQYVCVPFPVQRAHHVQIALDMVLALNRWRTYLFYKTDIIFFFKILKDHIPHVDGIQMASSEAKISLIRNKSKFPSDLVKYFGHRIRQERFQTDSDNTHVSLQLDTTNPRDQISFLSLLV